MKLNKLIKKTRIDKGITQVDLSKRLGFKTAQALCNIERGASPFPFKTLKKLVSSLGLTKKQITDAILEEKKEQIERYL